jgi:hypothetical protein
MRIRNMVKERCNFKKVVVWNEVIGKMESEMAHFTIPTSMAKVVVVSTGNLESERRTC